MDRFLRYFTPPIKRLDLAQQIGEKQANQVIARLKFLNQIEVNGERKFTLTQAGIDAWQVYIGVKK